MQTISEIQPVSHSLWLHGRWRYVMLVLGVALFFTPVVARVAGVHPTEVDNRGLVPLPSLSRGFGIFPDLTQWSIDHLPLRNLAVRFSARVSESVFGESPTYTAAGGPVGIGQAAPVAGGPTVTARPGQVASVIDGRDGWLFVPDEFNQACAPVFSLTQTIGAIRQLDSMLSASGRRALITLVPDKAFVDQRFVPASVAKRRCALRVEQQRWATLGALGLPDYLDLLPSLQAFERAARVPAFLPTDSHWSDRVAATIYVKHIIDALSPTLFGTAEVHSAGSKLETRDFSLARGDVNEFAEPEWSVTRPGVSSRQTYVATGVANPTIFKYASQARAGLPLVRGRAVIWGDSFTLRALDKLAPFFADLTLVRGTVADLVPQLRTADVVILEQSERFATGLAAASNFTPSEIATIQRALSAAPRGRGLAVR